MGKSLILLVIILFVLGVHLINVDKNLSGIKAELNNFFDFWFSVPYLKNVLGPIEDLYFHKLPISLFEYRFFVFVGFLFCLAWIIDVSSQAAIYRYKRWKYSRLYREAKLVEVEGYPRRGRDFKLFGICGLCSKRIYMPLQCSYCGEYYCDEHFLPPNHNCTRIDSWKKKGPLPPGVVWEHRGSLTTYRKY